MKRVIGLVAVVFLLMSGFAPADEAEHEEEEKKNELAVFAGALTNIDSNRTGPSGGVEYKRILSPKISIGGMVEYGDAGEREGLFAVPITYSPTEKIKVVFAPGYVLEESEQEINETRGGEEHGGMEGHDEPSLQAKTTRSFVARFGFGYEFEISKRVRLLPTLYFDILKGSHQSVGEGVVLHLVYGLTIGFPF